MRPTFPECCFTCEYRACDTTQGVVETDTGNIEHCFKEVFYCGKTGVPCNQESIIFKNIIDEILHVCDQYEKSWGKEQQYRRVCGLPELPQDCYPYSLGRKKAGVQKKLQEEYAKADKNGYNLREEVVMKIWNGEENHE